MTDNKECNLTIDELFSMLKNSFIDGYRLANSQNSIKFVNVLVQDSYGNEEERFSLSNGQSFKRTPNKPMENYEVEVSW